MFLYSLLTFPFAITDKLLAAFLTSEFVEQCVEVGRNWYMKLNV